jgi:hypothetical protein
MYYIVKWVLILFVTNGDCEINGISNHQSVFTTKGNADAFVLTLNTIKPHTPYGDYIDSVSILISNTIPNVDAKARIDTVCK